MHYKNACSRVSLDFKRHFKEADPFLCLYPQLHVHQGVKFSEAEAVNIVSLPMA